MIDVLHSNYLLAVIIIHFICRSQQNLKKFAFL
nr:MAG TPA: hypothetical protein [Caudoviricetes sp.]